MCKRVYDMAGTTPKDVRVYLNGKKIAVNDFKSYCDLYFTPPVADPKDDAMELDDQDEEDWNPDSKAKKKKKQKKKQQQILDHAITFTNASMKDGKFVLECLPINNHNKSVFVIQFVHLKVSHRCQNKNKSRSNFFIIYVFSFFESY